MPYDHNEARDSNGMWTAERHMEAAKTARTEAARHGHNAVGKDYEGLALKHEGLAARILRAIGSAVRTGAHEQAIADRSEIVLSDAIGVPRTGNNGAFDLKSDTVAIEVKTLVNGKNEKITMTKTALGRKLAEQRAERLRGYTIVVDRRAHGMTGPARYYVKEGFGSFRLSSMEQTTLSDIKKRMREA